ncbi:hypothetical protein KDK77_05625 [bacterium]|nr:hypothetical protein [bacterium]MCP5462299.1 hypothetical protein [bacterium]
MAEYFKYRKIIVFHTVLNAVYPMVLLIGSIAIGVLAGDSQYLSLAWWYPLFVTGIFIWLVYNLINLVRDISFSVAVSEQGITVKKKFVQWNAVSDYSQNDNAIGKDCAIELKLNDGTLMKIPAGLDGLPYVRGVINVNIEKQRTAQAMTV